MKAGAGPDSIDILYEDNDLLVLNKPSGLLSDVTLDKSRKNIYQMARSYLNSQRQEGLGKVELALQHRLDFETSGVLLFTKTKRAHGNISDQFKNRKIQKTYVALVVNEPLVLGGPLDKNVPVVPGSSFVTDSSLVSSSGVFNVTERSWSFKAFMKANEKNKRMQIVRSGGSLSLTHFSVLRDGGSFLLVEARPETGRTHQIRLHFLESGRPIVNDSTYCFKGAKKQGRLMLHAHKLKFVHPTSTLDVEVEAPLPEGF